MEEHHADPEKIKMTSLVSVRWVMNKLTLWEKNIKWKMLKLLVGLLIYLIKYMMSESSKIYINGIV